MVDTIASKHYYNLGAMRNADAFDQSHMSTERNAGKMYLETANQTQKNTTKPPTHLLCENQNGRSNQERSREKIQKCLANGWRGSRRK